MPRSNTDKQLEDEEGRVRWVYLDSEGKQTIGIGFLVDQRFGGGLDDVEIDFIFQHRKALKQAELDKRFPWARNTLDEVRYAALLNMCYQLGVDGVSKFLHMLESLKAKNWLGAYQEAKDSKWARQTPERAERMARQLLTGEWQWK